MSSARAATLSEASLVRQYAPITSSAPPIQWKLILKEIVSILPVASLICLDDKKGAYGVPQRICVLSNPVARNMPNDRTLTAKRGTALITRKSIIYTLPRDTL